MQVRPSSSGSTAAKERGSELIVGTVAPLGASASDLTRCIEVALEAVSYQSKIVHLSQLLHGLDGPRWPRMAPPPEEDLRVKYYMDRGSQLCELMGTGDALALLAVNEIRRLRTEVTGEVSLPAPRTAYILRSLKRKSEAKILRDIYGARFILIAGYASQEVRLSHMARAIARSHHDPNQRNYLSHAQALLDIDYREQERTLGQNVSSVFPQADVFLPIDDVGLAQDELIRFIELLFGNSFHTPRQVEQGMFFAYSAALRTASLSRQVGCALTTPDGSPVAVGTNEVAAPHGGAYWPRSSDDARDHTLGKDLSDEFRRLLIADVLKRLSPWLRPEVAGQPVDELVDIALADEPAESVPNLSASMAMDVLEYQRPVHAEMLAVTDAARRAVSTQGTVLFTTTFPCHNCAKHIVAAGISKVYYIEPYPKSLVVDLYEDSISVEIDDGRRIPFVPFIGVAPRRYLDWFEMTERKSPDGSVRRWSSEGVEPRLGVGELHNIACVLREVQHMNLLAVMLSDKKLIPEKKVGKWKNGRAGWRKA